MHSTPALHAVPERATDSGKLSKRQKSPFQSPSMSSFNYISTPYHGSTLSALHPERASTLTLNAISSTFARKGTEETNKNEVKEKKNKFFDFSLSGSYLFGNLNLKFHKRCQLYKLCHLATSIRDLIRFR